jgi:FkbM family methyltransferase
MSHTPETEAALAGLRHIGSSAEARARIVAALREIEPLLAKPGFDVRRQVTGPIVDALHDEGEEIAIRLQSGLTFTALYTASHITRDLVLRELEVPDHVFEPQTTKTLLALAKNAKHVLIGGAYSGDHAIPIAAVIAGNGGTVHGFEPNPAQQAMLRRNAAANGLTNVKGVALGLWDEPSARLSFMGTDALASTQLDPNGTIDVTTIDDYCAREGIEALDLIMIDIEGSELNALRGAHKMLSGPNPPAVVFEMNRAYVDWTDGLRRTTLGSYLDGLGFELYGIRDYQSHVAMPDYPVELVPADTAFLEGPTHGFNMLATRDPKRIENSIFRIVPDVSPKLLFHRDAALHAPQAKR